MIVQFEREQRLEIHCVTKAVLLSSEPKIKIVDKREAHDGRDGIHKLLGNLQRLGLMLMSVWRRGRGISRILTGGVQGQRENGRDR